MSRYKRPHADSVSRNNPVERKLAVVISGQYAGSLLDHGDSYMSFKYDPAYSGPNLSVALPYNQQTEYFDLAVRPVIEGLLPDNKASRAAMAKDANVKPDDIFGLLAVYGKDCPGAVQICTEQDLDSVLKAEGDYEPIGETEIAKRLIEASSKTNPEWHGANESWSLGGNQGKFALAMLDGKWHRCIGAYPSTHILKPGVTGMTKQALVEFVTMKLAAKIGLATASVVYHAFDGVDAIVVARYDRANTNGVITRIHQEDLCQALGYLPDDKYDATTQECIRLIQDVASSAALARFNNALFFNYLVGGIDSHAKNYSLLHLPDAKPTLAPLYDLASVLPYKKVTDDKWFKLPMSIGGQTKIGALTGSDIEKHAQKYSLKPDACKYNISLMAKRIPDAIEAVWSDHARIPQIDEIMEPLQRTVAQNCAALLANIDKTHDPNSFVKPKLAIINSGSLSRNDDTSVSPVAEVGSSINLPEAPEQKRPVR